MKHLATLAAVLFIAGCAAKKITPPEPKPTDKPAITAPEPKKSKWFGGHGWQS